MKIYEHKNIETVYATGDLHGEFNDIRYNISRHELRDCAVIVCGDIGIGFEREEYYRQTFSKLQRILSKNNIHLFMFRGNHDDPRYFDGKVFRNKNIHVMPDYSVIKTKNHTILCVGGAVSIDRTLRIAANLEKINEFRKYHKERKPTDYIKKFWWEKEEAVYDKAKLDELKQGGVMIDTVCTHSAPSFCQPVTKRGLSEWLRIDSKLAADLYNERKVFDEILAQLIADGHPVARWYYGHFHFHASEEVGGVLFTLLDMSRSGAMDMIEVH